MRLTGWADMVGEVNVMVKIQKSQFELRWTEKNLLLFFPSRGNPFMIEVRGWMEGGRKGGRTASPAGLHGQLHSTLDLCSQLPDQPRRATRGENSIFRSEHVLRLARIEAAPGEHKTE